MNRQYLRDRFYIRGTTPLGIFNTITGTLFNRVLVKHVDRETGKTVKWSVDKGTEHPPFVPVSALGVKKWYDADTRFVLERDIKSGKFVYWGDIVEKKENI